MSNIDAQGPSVGEPKNLDQLIKDDPDRVGVEEFIVEITVTTRELEPV